MYTYIHTSYIHTYKFTYSLPQAPNEIKQINKNHVFRGKRTKREGIICCWRPPEQQLHTNIDLRSYFKYQSKVTSSSRWMYMDLFMLLCIFELFVDVYF